MTLPDESWRPLDGDPVDLVSRVRTRASTDPGLAAVVTRDGTELSYRELVGRSVAAASVLGAASDERGVVVVTDRAGASAIALLAAAIARRPVALVDVSDPPERTAALVERLGLPVVDATTAFTGWSDDEPPSADPVLMLSTSGSTSDPKIALVTTPRWRSDLTSGESVRCQLVAAAAGSYPHVQLLCLSMWRGGTAVVLGPDENSASGFVDAVVRHRVTKVAMTPTLARAIVAASNERSVSDDVRHVNLRGERTTVRDFDACRTLFPAAIVHQVYASTEAAFVAYSLRRPGEPAGDAASVLEQMVDGVEVKLFGDDGSIVDPAPGASGELLVNGPDQFAGYVGRSSDDVVVEIAGRPWIRTGDRASFDQLGRLGILGRLGRRVKVAGMFVDLDEVATAFESHPQVDQAAVTWFDEDGATRLVAHLIPVSGTRPDAVAIRAAIARRLPVHAVPSLVRIVEGRPTNAAGKLDHRVLETWRPAVSEVRIDDLARQLTTPVEAMVASIASELLGRPVAPDADLIEAGFTSLDWLELVERLSERAGPQFEVLHLVDDPTIRGIARRVERRRRPGPVVRLAEGDRMPWVFWSVLGLAAQSALPLARGSFDRTVVVPVPNGFARSGRRAWSVDRIVTDMVASIASVGLDEGPVVVGFSTGCRFAQEVAARLEQEGTAVPLLVLLDPSSTWHRARRATRLKRALQEVIDRGSLVVGRGTAEDRHQALFRVQANLVGRHRRWSAVAAPTLIVRSAEYRHEAVPAGVDDVVADVILPDTVHHDVVADGDRIARLVEQALADVAARRR